MNRRLAIIVGVVTCTGFFHDVSARAGRARANVSHARTPTLAMTLTPTIDAGGKANGVDVVYILNNVGGRKPPAHGHKSPFALRWDTLAPTPGRSSDVIQKLVVRDASGPLTMTASASSVDGYNLYTSDRAPAGPVIVQYHLPVADPSAPNGRGPHREMIAAGHGLATTGDGFLLLPDLASKIDFRLHWQLPPGFTGVSSFGLGDVNTTRYAEDVRNGFYLAGPLRQFPKTPPKYGFSAYGLGENDIDMGALFEWSAKEFEATRIAFAGARETTFRAFFRSYDGGPLDSGRADPNGILLYIAPVHGERDTILKTKSLMAHEVIHVFQPHLSDGDEHQWFSEGSADYLAERIAFDADMITVNDYAANVDKLATAYYGNVRRNIPNTKIAEDMWKASESWMVPYSRGALYFADLDARVRTRSDGKITLVTMLRELGQRERLGKAHGSQQWRELVLRYAGLDGGRAYDAMLQGKTIIPVAGAFGPCMVAVVDKLGVADFLYRTAPRSNVITEVIAGSNAEKAGLRVGDRLAGNTYALPSFRDRDRPINLPIRRGGKTMTITYVPRTNGQVEARRWLKSPATECRKAS